MIYKIRFYAGLAALTMLVIAPPLAAAYTWILCIWALQKYIWG